MVAVTACTMYYLYKKEPDKIPEWMGETHEVPLPPSKKLLAIGCYWEEGKSVFSRDVATRTPVDSLPPCTNRQH